MKRNDDREKERRGSINFLLIYRKDSEKTRSKPNKITFCGYTVYTKHVCVLDSLFKDVLRVHPPVVLGQFDGEDDTGDQQYTAASQTKPECVLKNTFTRNLSRFYPVNVLFHSCQTQLN